MLNGGVTHFNVSIIARIDGETGSTLWAKQMNLNLTYSSDVYLVTVKVGANDEVWTIFIFKLYNDFRSSILKHNKDGKIINFFVIGKPSTTEGYMLHFLELWQMKYTTLIKVIFIFY